MNILTIDRPSNSDKDKGCRLAIGLRPTLEYRDGYLSVCLIPQGKPCPYPTYEEAKAVCILLNWSEAAELLRVFRGECEVTCNGLGIVHAEKDPCDRDALKSTRLNLHHSIAANGYKLTLGKADNRIKMGRFEEYHIFITNAEALGLSIALERAIGLLAFGLPEFAVTLK